MARIECHVEEVEVRNDRGFPVSGVRVTCNECGDCYEAFGTTYKSVRRCLVGLAENCDSLERNFYVGENGEEEG